MRRQGRWGEVVEERERDNRGDEEKEEGERGGGGGQRGEGERKREGKKRKEEEMEEENLSKNVLPWQLLSLPYFSPSLLPFLHPSSSSSFHQSPDLHVP